MSTFRGYLLSQSSKMGKSDNKIISLKGVSWCHAMPFASPYAIRESQQSTQPPHTWDCARVLCVGVDEERKTRRHVGERMGLVACLDVVGVSPTLPMRALVTSVYEYTALLVLQLYLRGFSVATVP